MASLMTSVDNRRDDRCRHRNWCRYFRRLSTSSPQGVTGFVMIAESHLAIHTWPEYGYAALDVFTCGSNVDPWMASQYLEKRLRAKSVRTKEVFRGIFHNAPGRRPTDSDRAEYQYVLF